MEVRANIFGADITNDSNEREEKILDKKKLRTELKYPKNGK